MVDHLLTGHSHQYEHPSGDGSRDLVLGTGGAPLVASGSGSFNGYAEVDQLNGARRVFRSPSKQQITTAMNHRRAYSGTACCRLQKLSPIHVFP